MSVSALEGQVPRCETGWAPPPSSPVAPFDVTHFLDIFVERRCWSRAGACGGGAGGVAERGGQEESPFFRDSVARPQYPSLEFPHLDDSPYREERGWPITAVTGASLIDTGGLLDETPLPSPRESPTPSPCTPVAEPPPLPTIVDVPTSTMEDEQGLSPLEDAGMTDDDDDRGEEILPEGACRGVGEVPLHACGWVGPRYAC